MLRHIVCFKFLKNIAEKEIDAIFIELKTEKDQMPGILAINCGKILNAESNFTHIAVMDFLNSTAFENHVTHPSHQALQKKLVPLLDGNLQTAILRIDFNLS